MRMICRICAMEYDGFCRAICDTVEQPPTHIEVPILTALGAARALCEAMAIGPHRGGKWITVARLIRDAEDLVSRRRSPDKVRVYLCDAHQRWLPPATEEHRARIILTTRNELGI